MHLSWHIIEFSLEVGDLTHSTELLVFTIGHNLINVEGSDHPVTHQRVLIVIISADENQPLLLGPGPWRSGPRVGSYWRSSSSHL